MVNSPRMLLGRNHLSNRFLKLLDSLRILLVEKSLLLLLLLFLRLLLFVFVSTVLETAMSFFCLSTKKKVKTTNTNEQIQNVVFEKIFEKQNQKSKSKHDQIQGDQTCLVFKLLKPNMSVFFFFFFF